MPERLFHDERHIQHIAMERPTRREPIFNSEQMLTPAVREALLRYSEKLNRIYYEDDEAVDIALEYIEYLARLTVIMPDLEQASPLDIEGIRKEIDIYLMDNMIDHFIRGCAALKIIFPSLPKVSEISSTKVRDITTYLDSIPSEEGAALCFKLLGIVDAKFLLPHYDFASVLDKLDWASITEILQNWSAGKDTIANYAKVARAVKLLSSEHYQMIAPNPEVWERLQTSLREKVPHVLADYVAAAPQFVTLFEATTILGATSVTQGRNGYILGEPMSKPALDQSPENPPAVRKY